MTIAEPFRWSTELRGLTTVAVELGLGDLPGVVPVLADGRSAPSVAAERTRPRRVVTAALSASGQPESLTFALEVCPPSVPCVTHTAVAPREKPWPAFAELLDAAATTLGVTVDDATRAAWAAPGSADTYAELLTGRACATWLGLLPAPANPGDKRTDPIARAVFLDPRQPLAQWVLARSLAREEAAAQAAAPASGEAAAALGTSAMPAEVVAAAAPVAVDALGTAVAGAGTAAPADPDAPDPERLENAIDAVKRAILVRPTSPLLSADLATLYTEAERPREALVLLADLSTRAPDDPRWIEPYAAALLATGQPVEAQLVLDRVPADFAWDPLYARLRVLVAEAGVADCLQRPGTTPEGCAVDLDPLLEHWQRADPAAVDPVRRRLQARVAARDYEGALPLVAALRTRAPGPQTDALDAALETAAGHLDAAVAISPPEVAARLQARRTREADPTLAVLGLPPGDRLAAVANADAALQRGDPASALGAAGAVLAKHPHDPEALVLRARALEGLGRASEAAAAWQEAWGVNPAAEGGPVATARIASTFRLDEPAP